MAVLGSSCLLAACSAASVSGLLSHGPERASIRLVLTGGGRSTFSGVFAGQTLSGEWSPPDIAFTHEECPQADPAALGMGGTFSGTFDGMKYTFHTCDTTTTGFRFVMAGMVGSTSVSGEADFVGHQLSDTSFSGKLGSQTVAGRATLTPEGANGDVVVIAASMTVN